MNRRGWHRLGLALAALWAIATTALYLANTFGPRGNWSHAAEDTAIALGLGGVAVAIVGSRLIPWVAAAFQEHHPERRPPS